jgi:type IV pilus assembly protein PilM
VPAVTHIGLDIGSTSIRAVEATGSRERPVISNFGQAMLPAGAMASGVVKDPRVITSALKQLWSSQNFKTRDVILGVSHQQVVVRDVEISNVGAKELKQSLPFQVRDVLPMNADEAVLDFYPLEDPGSNDTVVGLLVAAPKRAVLDLVNAVEHAGLHVENVDLSCFAALRAAALVADDTEAVIDVGAESTNLVIHIDGVPRIVRSIPRGGEEVTRAIATRMGMPATEAEELKRRVGLIAGEGPEISEIVLEALRPFLSEIRSSLDYYLATKPREPVSRLALVGGGSLLPGLIEQLTDELGIPAYLSDPLQWINDSRRGGRHDALSRFRSSAAVSIGLTLGAA